MAWWNRAASAVRSAVNRATNAVRNAYNTVRETVKRTVRRVSTSVKKVTSTVKKTVSTSVDKISSAAKKVTDTIKETVTNSVNKVKETVGKIAETVKDAVVNSISKVGDAVEKIKNTISETISDAVDKAKKKVKELDWKEVLAKAFNYATSVKLPTFGLMRFDVVEIIYETATGKKLTEVESAKLKLKIVDWIIPLNALNKLFFGKNLDGQPEEFGSTWDYIDLVAALAIVVPVGKIGAVGAKLGIKAGTKLGLKGFVKFAATKLDDAARLFKILNVDDQAKLIGKLSKTDDGIKLINRLIGKKALDVTLVKPTIGIVNAAITKKILVGKGLSALLPKIAKPKTIAWSVGGILGLMGSAYGVSFGTTWFAKEGLIEQLTIPLSDMMRDYRYEPTPEKAARIATQIDKLREAIPRAQKLIKGVSWLWPFTRSAWLEYADTLDFLLDQTEEEFEEITAKEVVITPETFKAEVARDPELPIPETFRVFVRDIIDGDTIDVSLSSFDEETGELLNLPQYLKTGHARVRLVGINAPERSPKGEIFCSDVEIYEVEKKWADESRKRLLPLNDKEVVLKIDPDTPLDTHDRVLAVVEHAGVDIGLRQIKEGLACGYYREPHKYYNETNYREETLKAKRAGKGMWETLEEIETEEEKIKIKITSIPTNAKLFLDDIALHHNTPSDEKELSDVIHLFVEGKHVLSAEKGGLSAMIDIEITKGDQGSFHLILETAPFPEEPTEEEIEEEEIEEEIIEEEIEEEEIIEPVVEPVKPAEIPAEYTDEQAWALKVAFELILDLTEGKAIMSKKEREDLISNFNLYTTEQKIVLDLLWRDLFFYTEGVKQLSADEYIELKEKYRMLE